MKTVDDRTEDQKETHYILVTAIDTFMSGWGGAEGGVSKCAWACDTMERAKFVYQWVESRKEMKRVNLTTNWNPRNAADVHIYVAEKHHPAFGSNGYLYGGEA